MRTEEIGMNGLSDFMTSKLVFLFPANLVKYAETFEKIRKESLKVSTRFLLPRFLVMRPTS